jgi:hypothetical protein
MRENVEYIIVGGPDHGVVSHRLCEAGNGQSLSQPCGDGRLCVAAARRSDNLGTRYLLLHPRATGEQFLSMLRMS